MLLTKRIICFDDDQDILIILKTILGKYGCVVQTHNTLQDYIIKIQQFAPDLIVLDAMFSAENIEGFEICRTIRKNKIFSKIPILMLTAVHQYYPCEFSPHPQFLPCDAFLNKPVDSIKLIYEISRLTVK